MSGNASLRRHFSKDLSELDWADRKSVPGRINSNWKGHIEEVSGMSKKDQGGV